MRRLTLSIVVFKLKKIILTKVVRVPEKPFKIKAFLFIKRALDYHR